MRFASAAAALMPEAILACREAHPGVQVVLVEQDRAESLDELQRGKVDLAVVFRPPEPAVDGVEQISLPDDPIDALLPQDHRLAAAETVALEELCDEPWAECSGRPVRQHMSALGKEPNVVFKSDHHGVVEGIVAAGIAVAFVPRLAQPVRRPDVIVKEISPQAPVRPIGIAIRAGDHRPAALRTMIDRLRQVAVARTGYDRASGPARFTRPSGQTMPHVKHR
jgi:DNA-binding transcriptional LysR family regulator